MQSEKQIVARSIEHTLLKPYSRIEDIRNLCREVREYGFAAAVVPPCYVKEVRDMLKDCEARVVTVAGFPMGYNTTSSKSREAVEAINHGADEIDMVINIGALKDRRYHAVREDIRAVGSATGEQVLKVIIETCYLDREEKEEITAICRELECVDYIKTSTGLGSAGATVEDVRLIKELVDGEKRVKAAGGIRQLTQARALLDAGADRIGTSSGVDIVASCS